MISIKSILRDRGWAAKSYLSPHAAMPALAKLHPLQEFQLLEVSAGLEDICKPQQLQWGYSGLSKLNRWCKSTFPHVGRSGLGRGTGNSMNQHCWFHLFLDPIHPPLPRSPVLSLHCPAQSMPFLLHTAPCTGMPRKAPIACQQAPIVHGQSLPWHRCTIELCHKASFSPLGDAVKS